MGAKSRRLLFLSGRKGLKWELLVSSCDEVDEVEDRQKQDKERDRNETETRDREEIKTVENDNKQRERQKCRERKRTVALLGARNERRLARVRMFSSWMINRGRRRRATKEPEDQNNQLRPSDGLTRWSGRRRWPVALLHDVDKGKGWSFYGFRR